MHTSFSDQLAGLDLAGFSIGPAPVTSTDFPVRDDASIRPVEIMQYRCIIKVIRCT